MPLVMPFGWKWHGTCEVRNKIVLYVTYGRDTVQKKKTFCLFIYSGLFSWSVNMVYLLLRGEMSILKGNVCV